jgi:hypothetical protein
MHLKQDPICTGSFLEWLHEGNLALKDNDHSSINNSQQGRERRKRVSFSRVEAREYPIIVGDHPSVQKGPPLTVSWEHVSSIDIDIDAYESRRDSSYRRQQSEMRLDIKRRQKLLQDLGFTMMDMRKGTKAAAKRRNQRKQSNAHIHADSLHESFEGLRRGLTRAATLGMKRRKEIQYLRKHVPNFDDHTNITH